MAGINTSPPTVEEVTGLLRGVIDPELGGNIVDLGMTTDVTISSVGNVTIGVKLTIAGCPLRAQIKKDVETRIADRGRGARVLNNKRQPELGGDALGC